MKSNNVPFEINEFKDYADKLTKEELAYIKQFYKEYYFGDFYSPGKKIIKSKKMKSEALRVHNSLNRDALNMGYKSGTMDNIDNYESIFMEDASDAWELIDMYETHGFEFCMRHLMNECVESIQNKYLDKHLILAKFFVRMTELKKIYTKGGKKL